MAYEHLLSPLTIRGKVYRNRMIAAPTLFAHSVYFIPEIRENVYRMVEKRAAGGFATVSTGELPVNCEEGIASFFDHPVDFTKHEGEIFELTKEYADRIKKHGAISYLEFCHQGAHAVSNPPYKVWGPSAFIRDDGVEVQELNEEMMAKIVNDFKTMGAYAKAAGFDGVLLHGGHGFIIQQFISQRWNRRTDEYGGSIENRARYPKRLIEAVREGIGEDMILEFRFSAEDGEPGGMTIDDTVAFMKEIDGMVDIIHCSNGLKWRGNHTKTFSGYLDIHGINVEYAKQIKAAVTKSKVAVIGGFNDPQLCEDVIAKGYADFIEFGRQGFADPEFPNKVINGQEDHIRRCVRCFQCYPGSFEHPTDRPLMERGWTKEQFKALMNPAAMGRCAINPDSGFGWHPETVPEPKKQKILVAGGGVGGLQAAITAAERGHKVTLIDKADRLGGTINFTDVDDDKTDLRNFKNMLISEAAESGADIRLSTPLTKELVAEINPDLIIVGIGAKPVVAPIPGIEGAMGALDVYRAPEKVGEKVVLVGGGLVGCEVGLYLAASGKEVTVVEMKDLMAPEVYGYYRNSLLEWMDRRSIKQYLNARCLKIENDGVTISQKMDDGSEKEIKISADTCVYSLGMKIDKEAVEKVKEIAGDIPYELIGDCSSVGKVGDAVRSGYLAAMFTGTR